MKVAMEQVLALVAVFERFKLNLSYGKYHAVSSSIMVNLAYVF